MRDKTIISRSLKEYHKTIYLSIISMLHAAAPLISYHLSLLWLPTGNYILRYLLRYLPYVYALTTTLRKTGRSFFRAPPPIWKWTMRRQRRHKGPPQAKKNSEFGGLYHKKHAQNVKKYAKTYRCLPLPLRRCLPLRLSKGEGSAQAFCVFVC